MREPGGAAGRLLRPLRRTTAVNLAPSSAGNGPAVYYQSPHGGGSLLRTRNRLDRVDYRAGFRTVSSRPDGPVPCLPRPVSFRRLADGGLGIEAHAFPDDAGHAPPQDHPSWFAGDG